MSSIAARRASRRLCALAVVLCAAAPACTSVGVRNGVGETPSAVPSGSPVTVAAGTGAPERRQLFGAFLGSDEQGVALIPSFEQFLGGRAVTVGHTYLDDSAWTSVEQPDDILDPWSRWKAAHPADLFVLNVPMVTPDEGAQGSGPVMSDGQVAAMLAQGASGAFDHYFVSLGTALVAKNLTDAVVIPGWEMNGDTYSHRCSPAPEAWKQYFRRVVAALRSVPGQQFVFDFDPSRGTDSIEWTSCYPGDDVVDVIGMDSYDQAPGSSWQDYVGQPFGLQAQVDFAAAHGKPVSYPEWGLSTNGDNAEFIRDMHDWITRHDTLYSTFTDYCPHGVFTCKDNPRSAAVFTQLFGS